MTKDLQVYQLIKQSIESAGNYYINRDDTEEFPKVTINLLSDELSYLDSEYKNYYKSGDIYVDVIIEIKLNNSLNYEEKIEEVGEHVDICTSAILNINKTNFAHTKYVGTIKSIKVRNIQKGINGDEGFILLECIANYSYNNL